MPKEKITLQQYLEKNFRFSVEANGDELTISQVTTKVNHAIEQFVTPGQVEDALATIARNRNYEPTRCYVYFSGSFIKNI